MNVKKTLFVLVAAGACASAAAHDFWVSGNNGNKFTAHIGYGHDFPQPEAIPAERVKLFEPLSIIQSNGNKTALKQTGANYQYEGQKLGTGSYLLTGHYKPTFWTKDAQGSWHLDGTKQNTPHAEFCTYAIMNAKEVIHIGHASDAFTTKPTGQNIEIVPLGNPDNWRVDKPFKIQVFANGKPVKTAKVVGTFAGFAKDRHAFSGTTDLEGVIEVVALRPGQWMLKATKEQPYQDKKVCDEETRIATLTFRVKP